MLRQVKVTTIDAEHYAHATSKISFAEPDDNIYEQNIQIAELNASLQKIVLVIPIFCHK